MDAMLAKALRLGHTILLASAAREVFIEGQTNILEEPEFAQIEKLKAILVTFEEKSNLLKILDKTFEAQGIQIFIGSEHGLGQIDTCSIIAYPIRTDETSLGSIAVVGPKRMNYQKVVPSRGCHRKNSHPHHQENNRKRDLNASRGGKASFTGLACCCARQFRDNLRSGHYTKHGGQDQFAVRFHRGFVDRRLVACACV